MRGSTRLRATGLLVAVFLLAPAGLSGVCSAAARFVAPADGPIVRHFEAPLGPYAAGHRGIDFGVPSGATVVASNSGTVTFAGPVADDGLFITIAHDGELKTTYSFLSQVGVEAGQEVKRGDPIGLSGEGHPGAGVPVLHFGARLAGVYIDPEFLLTRDLDDISDLISLAPLPDDGSAPGGGAVIGGGSSELRPIAPIRADAGAGGLGFFAVAGQKIESAAKSLWTLPQALGRWIEAQAIDIGRLFGKAADFGMRSGEAVAAAAVRVGKGIGDLLSRAGRFFSHVGRALGDALTAAKGLASRLWDGVATSFTWAKGLVVRAASGIARLWQKAKDVIAAVNRTLGRALDRALDWLGSLRRWGQRGLGAARRWLGDRGRESARVLRTGKRGVLSALARIKLALDVGVFVGHLISGVFQQVRCSMKGGGPARAIPTRADLARGVKPPPAPNGNIVVAIAGIGSSTSRGADGSVTASAAMYDMDLRTLGFSEDRIFHFSYRGVEEGVATGPYRLHTPYSKEDTYRSLRDSAKLLARQIDAIHALYPDNAIDLIAHSQGGLVAQYYVEEFYRRSNPEALQIDHLVTIATPHHGADAAQLHSRLTGSPQGQFLLEGWDVAAGTWGLPPPSSPAAREMAEDSGFIGQVNEMWDPSKVRTTTVAATFDFVVTPQHTRLPGAANYTADLPNGLSSGLAHGTVVGADSTKQIVYNALAGTPSACTALRNAVADHGVGRIVSEIEDTFIDAYSFVVNAASAWPGL